MSVDWSAKFAAFGSLLSLVVLLVGLLTSVAALTRTERLVRRLKTHTEILVNLSGSAASSKMQEIVASEVNELHRKLLPDHAETNRRFERAERVGGLIGLAVFGVGLTVELTTALPGISVASWLSVPLLGFLGYASGRQAKAQDALATRARPQQPSRGGRRGRERKG